MFQTSLEASNLNRSSFSFFPRKFEFVATTQGGNDNYNDGNGIVYDANGDTNNNIDHGDNYNYEDLNYIDINLFH